MTDQSPQHASPLDDGEPGGRSPDLHLSRDQEVGHYVEMWKQAVEVQMHFNDIEWRIRGLALTVATFALGAAGLAVKDGATVGGFSLGTLVILSGLLLWYAFYFVDRVWYHPLLKASVAHGTRIEDEIKRSLPAAGMTASITAGSKYQTRRLVRFISGRTDMHSVDKLVWFYKVGAFALALAGIAFQIGAMTAPSSRDVPSHPSLESPTAVAPQTSR